MPRKTFKRVIVTPELLEQVNPLNKSLSEKFLRSKSMTSSPGTIEGYRSDLNIFWVYNLQFNENKNFIDLKKIELSEYFYFCTEELKWSSARFGRMRSCLSSFSDFLEKKFDSEYPNFKNIVLRAVESMPKEPVREKTILSEDQVKGLLNYLSVDDKQIACWLALAVSSGARFSELLRFTTDIIDPEFTVFDGIFMQTKKMIKTKGRSRQGKMLNKYIIKDMFLPHYNAWLPEREKIMKEKGQDHTSIFIKSDGTPAEEGTVRSWISKIENYLNVPFYPHCLRHYIVTNLSRIGITPELIVHLMGWTSESMYKIYNDLDASDRKWAELSKLKDALEKDK
jgi:site-specific recombinase XerD